MTEPERMNSTEKVSIARQMYKRILNPENFISLDQAWRAINEAFPKAERVALENVNEAKPETTWSWNKWGHLDREDGEVSSARVGLHPNGKYNGLGLFNAPFLKDSGKLPQVDYNGESVSVVGQVVLKIRKVGSERQIVVRDNVGWTGPILEAPLSSITGIREKTEKGKCLDYGAAKLVGVYSPDDQRIFGYIGGFSEEVEEFNLNPGERIMTAGDFIEQSRDGRSIVLVAKELRRQGLIS